MVLGWAQYRPWRDFYELNEEIRNNKKVAEVTTKKLKNEPDKLKVVLKKNVLKCDFNIRPISKICNKMIGCL